MTLIVSKFTKSSELVMNPCSGTFARAHAFLLLAQHLMFVAGDDDYELFIPANFSFNLTFATQVLNCDSYITRYTKQSFRQKTLQGGYVPAEHQTVP